VVLINSVKNDSEVSVKPCPPPRSGIRSHLKAQARTAYQGLPADRLDEAIDDLGDHLSAYFGSPDCRRIAVHACLPACALVGHCGERVDAEVGFVLGGAHGDFLDDVWVSGKVVSPGR
jgi:hypothetical protein